MPSAVVGRQCPALSPTKNVRASTAGRSRCGIQLPWKRTAGTPSSAASRSVGSLTLSCGSNEPTPTRSSPSAGKLHEYPART